MLHLGEGSAKIIHGEASINAPSQLSERELYMTFVFHPNRTLAPNQPCPSKLRSMKRCVLLPPLLAIHKSILFEAIDNAPTKWTYVHLLHGGGDVDRVPLSETAFGYRNWSFATVITDQWANSDTVTEQEAMIGWITQLRLCFLVLLASVMQI